jgi:hypothetical protein
MTRLHRSTETEPIPAEPDPAVLGYVLALRGHLTDSSLRTREQAVQEKREWDRRPGGTGHVTVCEVREVP